MSTIITDLLSKIQYLLNLNYYLFNMVAKFVPLKQFLFDDTKSWTADKSRLTAHKNMLYEKMKAMREDIKTVEQLRNNTEQLAKADTDKNKQDMER